MNATGTHPATAPADRARGRRGPRAPLAVLATIGALGLLLMRVETTGGGGDGRGSFDYRLDGPVWADPALLVLALALAAIAMALWAARRRAAVGAALVLLPAVIGAGVATVVVKRSAGRIGKDEARAAARDTTKSAVRERLGAPAGHGEATLAAGTADCLVYLGDSPDRWGEPPQHMFCSRDGRVVARRTR
ncbi:MAG TPA: hypothetical protein VK486_02375 [Thermoleophilaceae bacterium]|nr:hypothetical protein [Thermoleophilaceae bacterium]